MAESDCALQVEIVDDARENREEPEIEQQAADGGQHPNREQNDLKRQFDYPNERRQHRSNQSGMHC